MSYQEQYKQKLTSAQEAVKAVKSGDWLDYGWSVCSPNALDKALAERMGELTDVNPPSGDFRNPRSRRAFHLELLAYERH